MIARTIQHHSARPRPKKIPAATTSTVAPAWIQALGCERSITQMPRNAQRKLLILSFRICARSRFMSDGEGDVARQPDQDELLPDGSDSAAPISWIPDQACSALIAARGSGCPRSEK